MRPGPSMAGRRTPSSTPALREDQAMADRAVFHYDFNSPYSYLAAERISAVFTEAGAEQPVWRPISLAFVLRASGRTPW